VSLQELRTENREAQEIQRATPGCRACQGNNLYSILNLGSMPLAGGFLPDQAAIDRERLYPLEIHGCQDCGLVQILKSVDPEVLFQDYSFSSSTIKPLIDHFESYARWLQQRLNPAKVVEFGCNDGVLLAPLERAGIRAVGVDVSRNITAMAREKGLDVVSGYFDPPTAKQIRDRVGPVDVVTGSNAFAHNERPELILEAANIVLSHSGFICLEFMYAGDLLEKLQWDTLYHEHLTFYSLHSIEILLKRFGFVVFDAERLPMHGGSLRVCASRQAKAKTSGAEEILKAEASTKLQHPETWRRFAKECLRQIFTVSDVYDSLKERHSIWAYGAAGKATMWVNACKMDYLGAVVDASPLRAGKLMPGTHTPIVPREAFKRNPPNYTFVTAWNYVDHIRAQEDWYDGIWSVPLPELRFF
jgi:C-methyltransferase C-terminal domain/Putative zinc binding domain/Methyltransferase domain